MTFTRILIALDRTPQSEPVFETGCAIAEAFQARIKLIHCVYIPTAVAQPLGMGTGGMGWPNLAPGAMNQSVQQLQASDARWRETFDVVQTWLRSLQQQVTDQGLSCEVECALGNPGDRICDLAQDWQADLIVMGRRDHSGLEEVLLGSTSNHVLHHAHCTLLTVQDSQTNHDPN